MTNIEKAKILIEKLSFDDCLKLIDELPAGSPIFDIACNRMESLDSKRFYSWLDN